MFRRDRNTKIIKDNNCSIIYDYAEYVPYFSRKKYALLSYLSNPVIDEMNGSELVRFSNYGLSTSWARVLNELGYIIDIIDWDNKDFVPKKDYDLLVFHGGKNFKNIIHNVHNKPQIIHWLTGSYWKFNNSQEDQRLANFKKRHGVKLARDRFIYSSEDEVNEAADGIIVLGDPSMRDTYPKHYKKVLTINNGSYPDNHFDTIKKNYSIARKNFLFFAGSGNIHKGLDLLIDSFKDLSEHLYIVAHTDQDVIDTFKKELALPNIHLIKEVGMRTAEFYDVMDKCAYVILPSCSEGQAGSVVEAMNQGLIPIVSKETRLDTTGYGYILKDSSIKEIKKLISEISLINTKRIENMSYKVRYITKKYHSPEYFRKNLKKSIKTILKI